MALNTEYDITKAFEAIEDELMSSMIRNMKNHKLEEIDEDKQWSMWQAEQLKALEKYRRNNEKKFGKEFKKINSKIDALIRVAQGEGQMSQEVSILKAIKNGFKGQKVSPGASASFFRLNERKLEALIESVHNDMEKAETAILRRANDQYRQIIFNAQVYANTGAGTYEKAVDMATKDMLSAGLNCVEYSNGARHTLKDYADMAIRTASKRAYLQGEGTKRQEWGISTVIVNKRGNPCPKCLPFCGKVLIDDVWSGGSKKDGNYPLMSYAVKCGLYHPRCKDSHTTYFPGISTADDTWTEKELDAIGLNAKMEAKRQYAKRQAEKYDRMAKNSLDADNKRMYQNRAEQWHDILADYESKGRAIPMDLQFFGGVSDDDSSKLISEFKSKFSNGKINKTKRWRKQEEHILGTRAREKRLADDAVNNKTPSSYFIEGVNIGDLFDKYACSGDLVFRPNQEYPVEFINVDKVIGKVYNQGTKEYVETKRIEIKYSSKGYHMFPVKDW